MTDLNDRFAAMLEGEPAAPYDIDRVVTEGRRALRRRNTLTAVAGTAGTAALTAAIVVPITVVPHRGGTDHLALLSTPPSPTSPPHCKLYYVPRRPNSPKPDLAKALRGSSAVHARGYSVRNVLTERNVFVVEACPPGAASDPPGDAATQTPTTPPQPSYRYDGDPQTIADGFSAELGKQVKELGFTIVYSRPFAQESSTLDKGHPTYYDGNIDVQLPDGPADIGVQVTHAVTELVPFDGECNPSDCTRTKLDDGSLLQVSHITAGTGGGEVIVAEVHHPNGLVVQAQESNYAFGPEATRARTKDQPLTIDQLTSLAEDPAFSF